MVHIAIVIILTILTIVAIVSFLVYIIYVGPMMAIRINANYPYFILNNNNVTMHSDSGAPGSDTDPKSANSSTGNVSFCCNQRSPWTSWRFERIPSKEAKDSIKNLYYIINMNSGKKLTVYSLENGSFTFNRDGATSIKYVNSPITGMYNVFDITKISKNSKDTVITIRLPNNQYIASEGTKLSLSDKPYEFGLSQGDKKLPDNLRVSGFLQGYS
jgi:hypothetical protein